MTTNKEEKTASKESAQERLQKKVMRLELAIMMMMNGLRIIENYPQSFLDRVEKLITSE
jgi:hypothetical protein